MHPKSPAPVSDESEARLSSGTVAPESTALHGSRSVRYLGLSAALLLVSSAVFSLVVAPPDALQGDVQRLMYLHVPAAWLAYLAFTVTFLASVACLKTRSLSWNHIAHGSAEVGLLFTALAIALGSLWGKPVWGAWWTWDPRLTTTAILLLVYVGYLGVQRLPANPLQRAKWAAVVGIVGFLNIPIVHFSVIWWRSLHQPPSVIRDGGPSIAGSMLAALLLAVAAFTVLYAYLLVVRFRVARLEADFLDRAILIAGRPVGPVEVAGE